MPDLQNFSITAGTSANVNVQRFTIECQVVDSQSGAVLADYTGANAILFPAVLATFTAARRRAILERIVTDLIMARFGG